MGNGIINDDLRLTRCREMWQCGQFSTKLCSCSHHRAVIHHYHPPSTPGALVGSHLPLLPGAGTTYIANAIPTVVSIDRQIDTVTIPD